MATTDRRRNLGTVVSVLLWVAALGVFAENVLLARQNRRLRELAAPQIAAGTQLQMLSGLALDGHVQPISFVPDSKLLIITFSPGCRACQANQEGWGRLASALKQKGVRVLWVSRDSIDVTREYCLKHGIPLSETLADPPFRTYIELGLATVPNTLLIGARGTVEKAWVGRLDPTSWSTLFAYFGERQDAASGALGEVGALPLGCTSEPSQASAKKCK
jgi:hypothetical protein